MPKTFINGIDLYYNIYGSGPPIILVHGLGMDQSMWDRQIPEFSRNYQVIVYDLRGHGQSESPDHPYSIDLFADDLHHFLRYLGLKESVLLGLSLGGRILLRFALKYPAEARALILADAQSETLEESKQRLGSLAQLTQREGMRKAAEEFFSWSLLQNFAERAPQRFQREKDRFAKTSPIGFARTCLAIAQMESWTGFLSEIKAPTLALAGEKDEAVLPFLETYSRQIPNCQKRTLAQAGHMSNLENPDSFNATVLSFLNGLARS